MKYLVIALFAAISSTIEAQNSNVIIYAEEGENFTLYINGKKFNDEPKPRVVAKELNMEYGQVKIEFDIPGAPVLKSPMMIEPGMEHTALIKKNKKGKYVLRLVSTAVASDQTENPERVSISQATQPAPQSTPVQTSTTTTTTTSTSGGAADDTDSFGFNVSVGGETVSMNVNLGDAGMEEQTTITTTETSTQSSSSRSTGQVSARVEGNNIILSDGRTFTWKYVDLRTAGVKVEMLDPAGASAKISYDGREAFSSEVPFEFDGGWKNTSSYFKLEVIEADRSWSIKLKNRNGNKILITGSSTTVSTPVTVSSGCSSAMSGENYARSKSSINNKAFAEEKLTIFKQIIRSNCVSVNQVVGFIGLFTYEEEKLEVAKLAYPKTTDKGNYYQVNDAFTYSETIEDLEAFLAKQ
ncbi:MAG: DUF4476 domain-containing protein [Cyclobacteriaceae bacterium]